MYEYIGINVFRLLKHRDELDIKKHQPYIGAQHLLGGGTAPCPPYWLRLWVQILYKIRNNFRFFFLDVFDLRLVNENQISSLIPKNFP